MDKKEIEKNLGIGQEISKVNEERVYILNKRFLDLIKNIKYQLDKLRVKKAG